MAKDYYDILGVPRTATADEIRTAHRRLVLEFHPDVNAENAGATDRFKEAQTAYDVLSDPARRRDYDGAGDGGKSQTVTAPQPPARQNRADNLGATPRVVTPIVKRRIWLEPGVRRWWLLGIFVLVMFGTYAGDRLWARHNETQLIRNGITLTAKIVAAENKVGTMPLSPVDMVKLEIPFPEQSESQTGYLSANNFLQGSVVVHVDPADHSHWTDRSTPTPLLDSLLLGLLGLPVIPVMLGLAYLEARGMLRTWKNGSVLAAVIFDRKHSPIAPMSYRLRCNLVNHRQKLLFTVYVPQIRGGLEKGDQIMVIAPQKKGRYLAALWMATA